MSVDPEAEYRRRLIDGEVRALGYSHRDETGRWVHQREIADVNHARHTRERARRKAARRCLTCGIDPHEREHMDWCDDATPYSAVGEALRDARDLEAAIAWQPPELNLPKLSASEREQMGRLFDALVRAREQARGQTPPKLWTLREWRDSVARRREESA